MVNKIENLKFLIIETAFSDKERRLAELALHLHDTHVPKLVLAGGLFGMAPAEIAGTRRAANSVAPKTEKDAICSR